ncbi:HDOD domain-containing protein [Glaciecola sp. 1036]|uniref:HDOD domain-containing protein n=1 Tax=Alteromonadaceae TaxID=72275 RepID=UPI003CFEAC7E
MKESVTQLTNIINDRFEYYLVSMDEAIIASGRKTRKMQELEDSEQFEARRELLFIEEVANRKREEEATEEHSYQDKVEKLFHDQLILDMEKLLKDPAEIMKSTLKFDPIVGKLLDILYTESCSISRLVACIEQLPWLDKSIINFIRQPKYRRLDSHGHPLIIKTLRAALSFIGIESLRKLIPVLIAKHFVPVKNDYIPDIHKHLWLYTIGTGNVARILAPSMGIKEHIGFNLGLFSTIGRAAIAQMYIKMFDLKLRDHVIAARKKEDRNLAKALINIAPSSKYLVLFWKKFALKATVEMMASLNMRWLMITPGYDDYTRIRQTTYKYIEQNKLHPLTSLLFKSHGFMQFKLLQSSQLITKEVSQLYLRNYGITAQDVSLLSNTNLTGLELRIAEKIEGE